MVRGKGESLGQARGPLICLRTELVQNFDFVSRCTRRMFCFVRMRDRCKVQLSLALLTWPSPPGHPLVMELNFNHFVVKVPEKTKDATVRAGFLMHLTESETTARQDLEEALERLAADQEDCWLDHRGPNDEVIDLSDPESWAEKQVQHTVAPGEEGLYSLIFVRCQPAPSAVSFKIHAKFYNPGPNYLSAGEAPLPTLYFLFFLCYLVAMAAWVAVCRRRKEHVHRIHNMMLALLVFKTLSLLFEAVRFQAYQKHGLTGHADGWAVVYYVFAFVKGIMRFVVILLIGTGWSLLKPYLSDREKKVVLVVLALQVIDNTAMVVLDELSQTSPGSASWLVSREGGRKGKVQREKQTSKAPGDDRGRGWLRWCFCNCPCVCLSGRRLMRQGSGV